MTESGLGFAEDMSPLHMFISLLDLARSQGKPDDWAVIAFEDKFFVQSRVEYEDDMAALAARDADWKEAQAYYQLFDDMWGKNAKDPFENADGVPHKLVETVQGDDVTWSLEDVRRDGKFPE